MAYVGALQYQGYTTDDGLGFGRGTEVWYVKGEVGDEPILNGTNSTLVTTALPGRTKGAPHPEIPGAIIMAIGVRSVVGPRAAFVSVVYSSDVRWGGGRVLESSAESGSVTIPLPMYSQIPGTIGKYARVTDPPQMYQRFTNTLHKTFYASTWGANQERVVFFNTGRLYLIGFLEYVLAGYYATRMPTNQVVVRYRFVCYAPVPAIAVPDEYEWFASLPPLGMNEVYEEYIDGTVPNVRAKPVEELYGDEYGEALPGID